MKKVIRLTENDITRLVKKVINEQDVSFPGGGQDSELNLTPSEIKTSERMTSIPVTMGSGLFENGVDKIDKNSQEFKKGLDSLIKALSKTELPIDVTIIGGASNVGADKGYNNQALAKRRADNFLRAVGESLPPEKFKRIKFKVSTKIGGATIKNSPEAKKEQFVQIVYPVGIEVTQLDSLTTARDATSTGLNRRLDIERSKTDTTPVIPTEDNPYMIVKIYYKKGANKDDFKKKILNATGSPARELINYKQALGLKFE